MKKHSELTKLVKISLLQLLDIVFGLNYLQIYWLHKWTIKSQIISIDVICGVISRSVIPFSIQEFEKHMVLKSLGN